MLMFFVKQLKQFTAKKYFKNTIYRLTINY